ncbi:hypothetical protein ACWFPY_36595 [Nocardia fluminea]
MYGAIAQFHPHFAPEFATILDRHGRDGGSIVTLWPIIGEYKLDYLDRNGSDDLIDAWVRQGTPVADLYRRPVIQPSGPRSERETGGEGRSSSEGSRGRNAAEGRARRGTAG